MITAMLATAAITFSIPPPPVLDCDKMLNAIKSVENWDGHSTGAAGEIGPYQILPKTFRQYSTVNRRACSPEFMRMVCMKHLLWLVGEIRKHHHSVTPFSVALAWTAGVNAVWAKTVAEGKFGYAERCEAVYGAGK